MDKSTQYTINEALNLLAAILDEVDQSLNGPSKISVKAKITTVINMFQELYMQQNSGATERKS